MCVPTSSTGSSINAKAAKEAVAAHPDSHIEIAMSFMKVACPRYLMQSNDCLLKMGRRLVHLVQENYDLDEALEPLLEECHLIAANGKEPPIVPKVRFGKTELQMLIVSLGCMRFQMEWGPRITKLNQVGSDCQDNLVAILKQALRFGINHIETARGYGCSELQLGVALKQLMDSGFCQRPDLILQTKVAPFAKVEEFRAKLEMSFRNLQVDYVDLFAFHGLNMPHQYDWVFREGGCYQVIEEYVAAGKIRHVGFSTHAPPNLIRIFIMTDKFEYCNLHYHYFGSYTASGCGPYAGNLGNVRLMNEKDMGVFCISAYDKGGAVYAPSNKLISLTLPEMEPMAFGSAWLWNHHHLDGQGSSIHTIVCGAARPSDLDLPAVTAHLQGTQPEHVLSKVKVVMARLEQAMIDALGKEWLETCYKGILKSNQSHHCVEHNQIIWMYNVIHAFGLYEFAKSRYHSLENNLEKWDKYLTPEENIQKNLSTWGYVPGLPNEEGIDYSDDFKGVPEANMKRVLEAEEFVRRWCSKRTYECNDSKGENDETQADDGDELTKNSSGPTPPNEWQTAYDMRVWPDFPARPSRNQ